MGLNEDLDQANAELKRINKRLAKEKVGGGYTRGSKHTKVSIWTRILSLKHKLGSNE